MTFIGSIEEGMRNVNHRLTIALNYYANNTKYMFHTNIKIKMYIFLYIGIIGIF